MGFIEDELSEVKKLCENVVEGSKLVSCVRSIVRVEIRKTSFKTLTASLRFPQFYPDNPILIELKSKTYSPKLLDRLTNVCEQEAKKYLKKAQILVILKFLRNFIDENPLACCFDEINDLKSKLNDKDELKLRQKNSSLILKVTKDKYYLESRIIIPHDYPEVRIEFSDVRTNFTPSLHKHVLAQAKEIARRCVEPPLWPKKGDPPFKPGPSLKKVAAFLIDCIKQFPEEECQICNQLCLPSEPHLVEFDEDSPKHVERLYCGHLIHLDCLVKFMKTPPFGNKKCAICGHKLGNHKWNLSDRLAENRWAHEQARERELEEVTDFFR